MRHLKGMTLLDTKSAADLAENLMKMGRDARAASRQLGQVSSADRTRGLKAMAAHIRAASADILTANAADMVFGRDKGLSDAMLDRLELDADRIEAIAQSIEIVADLPDPIGKELARWRRPNGLDIARVAVPLGVIGIIYESRPNVTADAGALCFRSGNAAILRCGSESLNSSGVLVSTIQSALKSEGLPEKAVQLVGTRDRAAVGHMLTGLDGALDVLVPRGGRSLVERVQKDARIPVIGHLEGLVHGYVDKSANIEQATAIIVNAKLRRTGICGSLETMLIDRAIADSALPKIASALRDAGCELRGDEASRSLVPEMKAATQEDWSTEYLAPILSIAVVDGVAGALAHIEQWSSGHTDFVLAEDEAVLTRFLNEVDSAIVLANASSQFADGGEFGMGAEIGIATGRIHARGPVGADQLTSYKYIVRGSGQTRT